MSRPDYYDVPECETQEKGAPKFCKKSDPGEGAERSCAYDGARVVLMPVTDAIHLVHGPIACAGNSWDNRGARSSGSQLYRRARRGPPARPGARVPGRLLRLGIDRHRRRRRGGLQCGRGKGPDSRHSGPDARVYRRQEHRKPPGRRSPPQARRRHGGAGDGNPVRHHPDRRVQHRGRSLGHAPPLREGRGPAPRVHLRRRALR